MTNVQQLTATILVSGQIAVDDIQTVAGQGVKRIISNRPDNEGIDQPSSASLESVARQLGVDFVHIPTRGMPDADAVSRMATALDTDLPVLMFCKSGMRSVVAWALATHQAGTLSRGDILTAAANAGYDLSGLPLD